MSAAGGGANPLAAFTTAAFCRQGWLEPLTAQAILTEAQADGVNFSPGAVFFAEGGGERALRLPFSYVEPPDLKRGVHILAQVIRRMLSQGRRQSSIHQRF